MTDRNDNKAVSRGRAKGTTDQIRDEPSKGKNSIATGDTQARQTDRKTDFMADPADFPVWY